MGLNVLRIPARYYRLYLEEKPYGCNERDFHYVEEVLKIPLSEAALVLVDCWSIHYCESWTSRARGIVEDKIVPVVNAARKVGLTIIHAPSSAVAEKYPQSAKYFEAGDEEKGPRYASVDPEWPPKDFVGRKGEYLEFNRTTGPPPETWREIYKKYMMIAEPLTPRPEDYIVRSGSQLHKVLKNLKKLHLFYAGFATNMCLQHRDYGMKAMGERGYNLVLLSDCTTAVETHDTVDQLLTTKVSVQEIEMKYAWSTTSSEFIKACG